MIFTVCYYLCMLASVSSELSLVVRTSTAQKSNGEYIVRAFGFTPTSRPRVGVCDPEDSVYVTQYTNEKQH